MNPFLGVFFHWLGGFASGSFYVPYRFVRKWAWETAWMVGGFFSWIIMPSLLALLMTRDLHGVLARQGGCTLAWTYLFGCLWGLGGLTFGLTMRYLGMSLGMGLALGYCAAFGTLLPPVAKLFIPSIPCDETIVQIASTLPGQITLIGVLACLAGIGLAAMAGLNKEREMDESTKTEAVKEFNFPKGMAVATFSGVMSACFAFALTAAKPIGEASLLAGTDRIWTGLPKLVVVLLGGFTTNFLWCACLHVRNGTAYQYLSGTVRDGHPSLAGAGGEHGATAPGYHADGDPRVPMLRNYSFSALAGTIWYLQFFFYTMGETQMGRFGFASWTLHMASIIIFSTMWGWIFHEWKGAGKKTHALIALGIGTLILSTVIIGIGTWLKGQG
ncbi:MAG: L-rhamnose-proton symporter [Verrucomicrobiota bacterium]|jgi:L-rhamnose-H+ transport protein